MAGLGRTVLATTGQGGAGRVVVGENRGLGRRTEAWRPYGIPQPQ